MDERKCRKSVSQLAFAKINKTEIQYSRLTPVAAGGDERDVKVVGQFVDAPVHGFQGRSPVGLEGAGTVQSVEGHVADQRRKHRKGVGKLRAGRRRRRRLIIGARITIVAAAAPAPPVAAAAAAARWAVVKRCRSPPKQSSKRFVSPALHHEVSLRVDHQDPPPR